jgi:hypothetical protein
MHKLHNPGWELANAVICEVTFALGYYLKDSQKTLYVPHNLNNSKHMWTEIFCYILFSHVNNKEWVVTAE